MTALSVGACLGPYEILAPLGAGGMGEVYQARDTRLGRRVAIKLLTAALTGDAISRERFEREARSIAALTHPHICTVHEIGDHEGDAFLVMELLEGHTLAARLAQTKGGLPLDEALSIATDVAEALAFAHRHHITHRDIKPANIVLSQKSGLGDQVKILDFGLARFNKEASNLTSGWCSGRRTTWRPSRSRVCRSITGSTSTRAACCCSSCSPGASRSSRRAMIPSRSACSI
jgi:eukaryotic-like serine/threonine-protein kinase